jgi:hypothetical protein
MFGGRLLQIGGGKLPSVSIPARFNAVTGTISTKDIALPRGAYVKAVEVVSAGDAAFAPIFVIAWIQDQPIGSVAENFNIEVLKGFVTDTVDGAAKDLDSGVFWHGDLPLPTDYNTFLNIAATNETGTTREILVSVIYDMVPGGGGHQSKGIQYSWPWGATWAFKSVFKQTNAGGGAINIDISPGLGSEFIWNSVMVGPDDYAAATSCLLMVQSGEATPTYVILLGSESIDNQRVSWPSSELSAADGPADTTSEMVRLVSGSDKLVIYVDLATQNEEVTLVVRARIRGVKPTVSKARSANAADVTQTDAYDLVI